MMRKPETFTSWQLLFISYWINVVPVFGALFLDNMRHRDFSIRHLGLQHVVACG